MRRANGIVGLVCLAVAVSFGVQSWSFMSTAQKTSWGQGLFPFLASLGLGVCGTLLLAQGFSGRPDAPVQLSVRGVALTVGSSAAYVVLMELIGFSVATGTILAALFRFLGLGWLRSLLLAVCFACLFHLVFNVWLYMSLPTGMLGF